MALSALYSGSRSGANITFTVPWRPSMTIQFYLFHFFYTYFPFFCILLYFPFRVNFSCNTRSAFWHEDSNLTNKKKSTIQKCFYWKSFVCISSGIVLGDLTPSGRCGTHFFLLSVVCPVECWMLPQWSINWNLYVHMKLDRTVWERLALYWVYGAQQKFIGHETGLGLEAWGYLFQLAAFEYIGLGIWV